MSPGCGTEPAAPRRGLFSGRAFKMGKEGLGYSGLGKARCLQATPTCSILCQPREGLQGPALVQAG